jgi:hypothetical protein
MFADARVEITDGDEKTTGRVWGGIDFAFENRRVLAPGATGEAAPPAILSLGALELTCERGPEHLVPCYSDLVAALRDRGAEFSGELTRTFARLLDDIFVDQRVGATGLSADLVIRAARASTFDRSIHLELDATLVPKR